MSFDLTYLSFGAGVQSSALLVMSALGLEGCPRADVAIFADTQIEPDYVYRHLEVMERWAKEHGIPVERVTEGNLAAKVLEGSGPVARDRFVTVPAFVSGQVERSDRCEACGGTGYRLETLRAYYALHAKTPDGAVLDFLDGVEEAPPDRPPFDCEACDGSGKLNVRWEDNGVGTPLRRQCTREFKIQPIERRVRALMGLKKGEANRTKKARALLGISLDEAIRARDNARPWITNAFPLLDARMRREDCLGLLERHGLPKPGKSACYVCPYHSDAYWRTLKREHPDDFQKAVAFDERIRRLQTVRGEVFLHRSLKPLATVRLDEQTGDLFGNDCESGVCGV